MGKSKKSTPKVDAVSAAVPEPTKSSTKNGKREAEVALEKVVNTKKQKVETDGVIVAKKVTETKTQKKIKEETSSSESDDEPDVKPASKKSATPVKAPLSPNSDDSDNEFVPKKAALVKKNPPLTGPTVKTGKKDSSTDSDSSESESDKDMADQSKVNSQLKKPASGNVKNGSHSKVDTSTDESDSDADTSSEEEVDKQTVGIAKTSKKEESDDSSSSDSSDDEVDTKAAASGLLKAPMEVKKDESESESDSEEDDESDSDKKNAYGGALKPTTAENDGSTDSSDSDSDDEPSKEPPPNKAAGGKTSVKPNEEDTSDEDDSSEESSEDEKSNAQEAKQGKDSDSDEEDSENEQPTKVSNKKDLDVKMVDATKSQKATDQLSNTKAPKAPAKPQSQDSSSKILFVGNLSYSATPEDVENFFKAVADVQEVRLSKDQDGNLRGFGHVEFSSAEDARKALELNGQELFGRALKLDFTRERGSYTPQSKESNSFQRGVRAEGQTIFVRGFDISLGEEEIRSALQEHFGSCGEISRVSVPTDFTSGAVKGIAYLDFKDAGSLNSALELSGSDLGGYSLYVDQARPKGDVRAGGDWSGGRSGGRGSGRWSGGRSGGRGSGRGGARDSGGRFGGRRGGGRGGGRRGGRG